MAKGMDPKVRVARGYTSGKRTMRSPAHPFMLRTRPYQIQPFMLSPVLPGETLRNLVTMSRVVTKPIKNALVGWWCEYYFFYVRLKDIEFHLKETKGEWLADMVTNPGSWDPTPLQAAADAKFYHPTGGVPWIKYAMETVVEYYFRDQGEDWDTAVLDGLPLAQVGSRNWMDSLTLDDNKRTDRDVDLDINNDGNITAREMLEGMELYNAQRDAGLEQMDYEDWVRTFGVQTEEVEDSVSKYRPELVRYFRQWQYPTNTVEPTTGVPSSAVSWINAFRADKDRLFKEPGFLIGLTVQKPKAYLSDPTGSLNAFMQRVENWLPALQHKEYERGFIGFDGTAGPLAGKIGASPDYEGYWVDLRDLFKYGDQFANFALDASSSAVKILEATGRARYPSGTEIDALFAGDDKYIQTDGIVNLSIAGRVVDRTRGQNVI